MNRLNSDTIKIKSWMGCLGFLGFLGPIVYYMSKNTTAFLFEVFFAFFALYWEGKFSTNIKDEKFIYNKLRAGDMSGKFGLVGVIIIIFNAFTNPSIEGRYTYLIMCLPIILSVQIIVRSFLLYKYEKKIQR